MAKDRRPAAPTPESAKAFSDDLAERLGRFEREYAAKLKARREGKGKPTKKAKSKNTDGVWGLAERRRWSKYLAGLASPLVAVGEVAKIGAKITADTVNAAREKLEAGLDHVASLAEAGVEIIGPDRIEPVLEGGFGPLFAPLEMRRDESGAFSLAPEMLHLQQEVSATFAHLPSPDQFTPPMANLWEPHPESQHYRMALGMIRLAENNVLENGFAERILDRAAEDQPFAYELFSLSVARYLELARTVTQAAWEDNHEKLGESIEKMGRVSLLAAMVKGANPEVLLDGYYMKHLQSMITVSPEERMGVTPDQYVNLINALEGRAGHVGMKQIEAPPVQEAPDYVNRLAAALKQPEVSLRPGERMGVILRLRPEVNLDILTQAIKSLGDRTGLALLSSNELAAFTESANALRPRGGDLEMKPGIFEPGVLDGLKAGIHQGDAILDGPSRAGNPAIRPAGPSGDLH